jgi:hypothetical protein
MVGVGAYLRAFCTKKTNHGGGGGLLESKGPAMVEVGGYLGCTIAQKWVWLQNCEKLPLEG